MYPTRYYQVLSFFTKNILDSAIKLAKQRTTVIEKGLGIMKHCKKLLIYNLMNPRKWKIVS